MIAAKGIFVVKWLQDVAGALTVLLSKKSKLVTGHAMETPPSVPRAAAQTMNGGIACQRGQLESNSIFELAPVHTGVTRLQMQNISHGPVNSFIIVVNYNLKPYSHFSSLLVSKSLSSSTLPKDISPKAGL